MKCFWHKWSKWSDEIIEIWERIFYNHPEQSIKYERRCQQRKCSKCNKIDIKYFD